VRAPDAPRSRPARRAAWLCRPPGNGRTTQTPTHANTNTTHPLSGLWSLIIITCFIHIYICSCKILRNSYTKIRYKAGRNRGFHNKTKVHFLADVNIRKIRNIRCTLTVLCQTCPLDSRKLCLLWPWPRGRTRIYGFQIHLVKRVLLASVSNEAH
jgi:hypothetical protein